MEKPQRKRSAGVDCSEWIAPYLVEGTDGGTGVTGPLLVVDAGGGTAVDGSSIRLPLKEK